jgi:hypothetical protein
MEIDVEIQIGEGKFNIQRGKFKEKCIAWYGAAIPYSLPFITSNLTSLI